MIHTFQFRAKVNQERERQREKERDRQIEKGLGGKLLRNTISKQECLGKKQTDWTTRMTHWETWRFSKTLN